MYEIIQVILNSEVINKIFQTTPLNPPPHLLKLKLKIIGIVNQIDTTGLRPR